MGHRFGRLVAAGAAGYLMGAFPSADAAARLATRGETDLRAAGSGNPGAANAIALLGPRWGYGVMAADIGKGAIAARVGSAIAGDSGAHLGGVGAVAGHCFPWYANFRGGKGVAASAGQCLATFPAYFPIDLAVAGITGVIPWWRKRAFATTAVSSSVWIAACVLWWRKGWPNLWGPRPAASLPAAALATSAMITYKFATATRPPPMARPQDVSPDTDLSEDTR